MSAGESTLVAMPDNDSNTPPAITVTAQRILMSDMTLPCRIGVTEEERAKRQDVSGMTRAHNAFHELILETCGNRKIQQVVAGLVRQFLRFRFYVASLVHVQEILREHAEIVAAIRSGDGDRAEACMKINAQLGLEVLLKEFSSVYTSEK